MTTLSDLKSRVLAGSGEDRELDGGLYWVLCPHASERVFWNGAMGLPRAMDHSKPMPGGLGRLGVCATAPRYTTSLDARIALAEEKFPGQAIGLLWKALDDVYHEHGDDVRMLPRALLAALLTALDERNV